MAPMAIAIAAPAMTFLRPTRSESAPMNGMAMQIATRLAAVTSSAVPVEKPIVVALEERRHVGEQHVVAGAVHQRDEQREQHRAAVLGGRERFLQRVARQAALSLSFSKFGVSLMAGGCTSR